LYSSYRKLSFSEIFGNKNNNIYNHLPKTKSFFECSSGREGLEVCLKLLCLNKEDSILMPALTAEGAIRPFLNKKINIIFYDIDENLQIDINKIEKILEKNTSIRCLFVIHYLGYSQKIEALKNLCEKKNLYLIEDCAQSLFSHLSTKQPLGSFGHISLFSLGKTIPVIDGALFFINSSKIKLREVKYYFNFKIFFSKFVLLITLLLNNYINNMKKKKLFWKLNAFNKFLYDIYYSLLKNTSKPKKMSFISKKIIKNLNYEDIIEKTKLNIKMIYQNIDRNKYNLLVKDYNHNFLLLGVPIMVTNRNELRKKFISKGIFCTIFDKFWNFIPQGDERSFPNTDKVLKNILILPVSYKSKTIEIYKMVEIINNI